jgi:ethanolamine ammonia-lyase small subunit
VKLRRLARVNEMVGRNDLNILAEWISRHMVDDQERAIRPDVARELAEEVVEYLEKRS